MSNHLLLTVFSQIKSLKKSDRNIVRIAIIAHAAFAGELSVNPDLVVSVVQFIFSFWILSICNWILRVKRFFD